MLELSSLVGARLRKKQLRALTVTAKIRTRAFKTYTRSRSVRTAIDDDRSLYHEARRLLSTWWAEQGPAEIRLLGMGVSNFTADRQQSLFDQGSQSSRIDQVADQVRSKYGSSSIRPAALVKRDLED